MTVGPGVVGHRRAGVVGRWLIVAGAVLGVTSIMLYATGGDTLAMRLSWVSAVVTLAVAFESMSSRLPRVAFADLVAPAVVVALLAPLYLVKLYDWPVQVGSDEVSIMTAAQRWADQSSPDLFGLSDYLGHPALLFVVWGSLGELFGGIDLATMRALHGAVSLLAVGASYFLFRQLLPRRWALVAMSLLGVSHALLVIGRLAMRESTALLIEVVALALFLRGLRHRSPLPTFLGGVVAGLGFYVYQPARATIVLWLIFLTALLIATRGRLPPGRVVRAALVAVSAFALVASPVIVAELKAPDDQINLSRESLLVFEDARDVQQGWVFADSRWEGFRTNIGYGLGAFNDDVVDHGWIYVNWGHGFVDPLTGVLLWLGVLVAGYRVLRKREVWALLPLTAFFTLWLSFAFLVNKAPNYTRLLVVLPFVAYFVTEAIRAAASALSRALRGSRGRVAAVVVAGLAVAAIAIWNVSIAYDYVQAGRADGDDIGSTGRYIQARSDVPGMRFYLAANDRWPYYVWGFPHMWQDRMRMFARDGQVQPVVSPPAVGRFDERPPFVLLLSRVLWNRERSFLERRYPEGNASNVMPDGSRIAFEVRR